MAVTTNQKQLTKALKENKKRIAIVSYKAAIEKKMLKDTIGSFELFLFGKSGITVNRIDNNIVIRVVLSSEVIIDICSCKNIIVVVECACRTRLFVKDANPVIVANNRAEIWLARLNSNPKVILADAGFISELGRCQKTIKSKKRSKNASICF